MTEETFLPVPPDADMRGLAFMPLDVGRLLDSDLFALSTGEEFKAAVALWCKCWTQIPAGSLPDDDRVLAHLSGAGSRWSKLKRMALHGFIKAEDGRLYHSLIAEKVNEAWAMRLRQRERSNRGNSKRWGKDDPHNPGGDGHDNPYGDPSRDPRGDPNGDHGSDATGDRKGQGQSKGQLENDLDSTNSNHLPVRREPASDGVSTKRKRNDYPTEFIALWEAYPRTPVMGKLEAYNVWKKLSHEERDAAMAAIPAYKAHLKSKPNLETIHLCRFLSKRRAEGLLESVKRVSNGATVFVKQDTPQWEAWSEHYRKTKGKGPPINNGGWYFDTEWPPRQVEAVH